MVHVNFKFQNQVLTRIIFVIAMLLVLTLTSHGFAKAKKPIFYVSFDKNVDADISGGGSRGVFGLVNYNLLDFKKAEESIKNPLLKWTPGFKGKGLLTGVNGQVVYYSAKDNINPENWTITFWVKGLENQNYLSSKISHQQIFEMNGKDGWTRFYKYQKQGYLRFLIQRKEPGNKIATQNINLKNKLNVEKWIFFSLTYRKNEGVKIYVNGILVAEDAGMIPIQKPTFIRFGQSFGGDKEPNRIMDELKIYPKALAESEILTEYKKEKGITINQQASVLKTQGSIVIDGSLDDAGWRDATVLNGLINHNNIALAQENTRVLVTYDDQYLYLAMHSELPDEARNMPETTILHGILKSTKVNHDVNVEADDSFGIDIIPRYPMGKLYRLVVNSIETTYEYSISLEKEVSLAWDPAWEVKSQVSLDGWFLESRIPLKDLGVDQIADGEQWKFQFCRYWKQLKDEKDTWTYRNIHKKERGDGFGTITFRGREGVAVNCKTLDRQDGGEILKLQAQFTNGSGKREFVAELKNKNKSFASKNYILNAGEKADFRAAADLRTETNRDCQFSVRGKDGKVYWVQNMPQVSAQKSIDISLRQYPSINQILLSWKLRQLKEKIENISMSVDVLSLESGGKLYSKKIKSLNSPDGTLVINSEPFAIGQYHVVFSLYANGKKIASQLLKYEKKTLPDWWDNNLGISDQVPPPWTPLKVAGDAVSMWNRTYDFKGHLFPSTIMNQGENILDAPINLQYKISSSVLRSSHDFPSETKWTEKTDCKVSSVRKQRLDGVTMTSHSYIEFDGMMWIELEVAPNEKPVKLEKLVFSIPLKKKYATLLNAGDYSLRKNGTLPPKGYSSRMGTYWLGNEDGGVQVFAETSYNWILSDKQKEFEIINGPRQVVMKLNIINKPVIISQPLKFAFGLIVTPVKKTVPHRDILSMSGRLFYLINGTGIAGKYYKESFEVHKNIRVVSLWNQGWWKTEQGYKGNPDRTGFYPFPKKTLNPDYGQVLTKYGNVFERASYARLQETWAASPEFPLFEDEWTGNTNKKYISDDSRTKALWHARVCQNSKSFQDFTLAGLNQLLNGSKVKAFYFDVSKPHDCNNIRHGCGIDLGDDVPSGFTKNILGTRQLIRRIYTLLKEKHPDGLIFFHMSGYPVMPCWSFTDALVDGENFVSLHDRKNNRGMENFLTLDKFAAEYAAQNNFGPYTIVLPQFTRSGAIKKNEWKELGYQHAEYLLGLIFLHNSQLFFPAYIPVEPTAKLYLDFDRNGLDSTFEYTGYWKQHAVQLPKNIKASFFVSPDKKKAFMLVMNLAWKDAVMDLKVNPAKLGMKAIDSVQMLYREEAVHFTSGTIKKATIPAKNFQLYLLACNRNESQNTEH